MGMYSEVINSSGFLGDAFIGLLQTKNFECILDFYWIDPSGNLFKIDDKDTWSFEALPSNSTDLPTIVKTGLRGRVVPYLYSGSARFTAIKNGVYHETVVDFISGSVVGSLSK